LRTTDLTLLDWFVIIVASVVPVGLVEAFKHIRMRANAESIATRIRKPFPGFTAN